MISLNSQKILSPLLLRLIDKAPKNQLIKTTGKFININELYSQIGNNINNILNARPICSNFQGVFDQIEKSVLNYGIMNFSNIDFNDKQAKLKLCRTIKKAISYFEPRLCLVNVVLEEDVKYILKIYIIAMLDIKPEQAQVSFEFILDVERNLVRGNNL